MSKHTKGPWELVIDTNGKFHTYIIRQQNAAPYVGVEIARANPQDIVNREPNARLIAAAPDLLESLKALIEPCRHRTTDDSHIDMIEAAIAKAEGRDEK